MNGLFVTATGTGAGKTTITAQLVRALRARGRDTIALKPIETGAPEFPLDAIALAEASGDPSLALDPRLYRTAAPLSPYAAALDGAPALDVDALVHATRALAGERHVLVEGAGGLLVPLDRDRTIADLAAALDLPLLLVAPDRLGVLSDVLAVVEAAERRGIPIVALVLSQHRDDPADPSPRTNATILAERLRFPVLRVAPGGALPEALIDRIDPA